MPHHRHHQVMKTIVECGLHCQHMITLMTKRPDVNMRSRQILLLGDCADICALTATYIARGSVFGKGIADFCATVCDTCASECSRFPDQDSQHCATICMNCAAECRAFSMT